MQTYEIIGGTIILGLAFAYDPGSTVRYLSTALSVRGAAWLAKRVLNSLNADAAQIINLAGWSIAGISLVKILKNSLGSVGKVKDFFAGAAEFIDKVTFWD